jgi:type IV pilus assembly protein PilQ
MTRRLCFRKSVFWFTALLLAYFLAGNNNAIAGQLAFAAPGPYQITGIKTVKSDDGVVFRVAGSSPPTFTMYELFEPQRVILDIADGSFAQSLKFPIDAGDGPVSQINGKILDDKEPLIARLEMLTVGDATYTVERDVNDIVIYFKQKGAVAAKTEPAGPAEEQPAAEAPAIMASAKQPPVKAESPKDETTEVPKEPEMAPAQPEEVMVTEVQPESASMPTKTPAPAEPPEILVDFSLAGYTKQPITVDFYKIDIHNVFRLFGEISGMNILITEGVGGNLTLALDNVPWDFVLDIILNLHNLQAIERYNTLVVSPKGMEFVWPERKPDKVAVAVKEDKAILEKSEKLQIIQKMELTPEVLEAQKLTRQARVLEKEEEFEDSLSLYEKAYDMWPENGKLAARLASLYLVHMGMNAKAAHYGKAALKIDENDRTSALYTAIGLANMKKNAEAKEYFDMSVTGERPESEALISYAMFSEENEDYLEALLLLARHEDQYGDSLDTMIARARIFDKEGNSQKAAAEYRAILLSGYQLPADLTRYIKGRLVMEDAKSKGQMQ